MIQSRMLRRGKYIKGLEDWDYRCLCSSPMEPNEPYEPFDIPGPPRARDVSPSSLPARDARSISPPTREEQAPTGNGVVRDNFYYFRDVIFLVSKSDLSRSMILDAGKG